MTIMDIVYKEYVLTADEFILFADKMGETDGMMKEQAEKSITNHCCCIAAFMCDEIIGIGRLIGDKAIFGVLSMFGFCQNIRARVSRKELLIGWFTTAYVERQYLYF